MVGKACLALFGVAAAATAVFTATPPAEDIYVIGEPILASAASAHTSSVDIATACTDSSYTLESWHLAGVYQWNYNPAGAPASVASTALATFQRASATVATGQNRCGIVPKLSTSQQYLGTTTKAAQIDSTGKCTGNDGVSVTSWGTLPSNYLGYTCVYYRGNGAVVSSDMLLDAKAHQWFTTMPASCSNTYDLESVAAHERGHTAGLNHVSATVETMSPSTRPCDTVKRALARGDLLGLQKLYG